MPKQQSVKTNQRHLLCLESICRLSGRANRWVTVTEIVQDIQAQGYDVKRHSIHRDMQKLLLIYSQLECNDNTDDSGQVKTGLPYGYRWLGKDLYPDGGITLPEALSLVMAERYLQQSLPLLLNHPIQELFNKAHEVLNLHKSSKVTRWPEKFAIVQPSQPFLLPTIDPAILETVQQALLEEKQLEVVYVSGQKPAAKAKTYRLHPLGLLQRGPVTYIAAMNNDHKDIRQYAVHRLQAASLLPDALRKNPDFNLAEFAHSRGHFGTGEIIQFKAKVCPNLAGILAETKLSECQTMGAPDEQGNSEVSAQVRDTWQFHWWLLGECERLEVLEPESLRETIKRRLVNCLKQYDFNKYD